MKNTSIIMSIYYAYISVKTYLVIAVLKPLLKIRQAIVAKSKSKASVESTEATEVEAKVTTFDDIAGYTSTKQTLAQLISGMKNRNAADTEFPSAVLLYGPHGTGKSLMLDAAGNTSEVNVYDIEAGTLHSRCRNLAESILRYQFQKARETAPSIVIIDDIDEIANANGDMDNESYRRTYKALLNELRSLDNADVLVLAAASTPELMPEVFECFDLAIAMPLPDSADREAIIEHYCKATPLANHLNLNDTVAETEGMSCADIVSIFEAVGICPKNGKANDPAD